MSRRFFVETPVTGDAAELVGDEAHHLIHVLRAQVGAEVTLFDGSGWEFPARVARLGKSRVELTVLERRQVDRELPVSLTLAVALPKGERQRWLVEKAVELGVARLVPLLTQRGVAQPVDAALDRLRRSVIEASKQCGRNRLLEIAPPLDLAAALREAEPATQRLVAHPGGEAWSAPPPAGAVLAAIGPEGGFTESEIAAAQAAGAQVVSLGGRLLRVETAALAVAARVALGGT